MAINASAKYGIGYCDALYPHDLNWINGEANVDQWVPSDVASRLAATVVPAPPILVFPLTLRRTRRITR